MPMKSRRKSVAIFLCLTSVLLLCSFNSIFVSAGVETEPNFLKYEVDGTFVGIIIHSVRIENPSFQTLSGGKLIVPLINNQTARHYVVLASISSSEGQPVFSRDNSDNLYAIWNNIALDGNQAMTAEMNYYVLSFSTRYLVNASRVADYDKNSELYRKYTQREELIESNNPEIVSTAQNITGEAEGLPDKVSKIYSFVIKNMHYAVQDEEKGALWALRNRVGDCSEYSYLFVALCRAIGIPARIQAGFVFHTASETTEDGHMWAEYYLENYGWIPVDASWRQFNRIDTKHFSSIQSIPEKTTYINLFFSYTGQQELTEKQNITIKPSSTDLFGNNSAMKNIVNGVSKINQAKFTAFFGKIFGSGVLLPSEVEKIDENILESETHMLHAIEVLEGDSQNALLNVSAAITMAEDALEIAWLLIAKMFTIFFSIFAVIPLSAVMILKWYRNRRRNSGHAVSQGSQDLI